jgi:hypothetical protein
MPWQHTDSLDKAYAELERRPEVISTESKSVVGPIVATGVIVFCGLALGVMLGIIKLF